MAIAGKVAITLSTENGGAWSADVTYDRLVAVKHNNNLYISRKTVANVEPPNDEFWFFALEGFGGDDVESILQAIENIINGSTQVGNAKTIDGHGAEYFASLDELSNYFKNTGGTVDGGGSMNPLSIKGGATTSLLRYFNSASELQGYLGFVNDKPVFQSKTNTASELFHTGNKPTGTYTGTGVARTIDTGAGSLGKAIMIEDLTTCSDAIIVGITGAFGRAGGASVVTGYDNLKFDNGVLALSATTGFNISGSQYKWYVF